MIAPFLLREWKRVIVCTFGLYKKFHNNRHFKMAKKGHEISNT